MGNIIVGGPNKAKIISGVRGQRVLVGKCGLALWLIETTGTVNMEVMTLQLVSKSAESAKGVKISITSVAQVKVNAIDEQGRFDEKAITLFASHFLGKPQEEIDDALRRTLEGHQRQIIGTLTVEEIYKDRRAFSERVREHVMGDLISLGATLASYTVTDISDSNGYMDALGATATAQVKAEAEEGKSKNESAAAKVVAQNRASAEIAQAESAKLAHTAKAEQQQAVALADRDLEMKRAEYAAQVNKAREEAEAAGRIERAMQDRAVIREVTQQKVTEAEIMRKVADEEIERSKAELQGNSAARLLEQENEAKAVRVKAEAEAERIRQIGEAEANAVQKKGEAEAAVLAARARAYNEYGDAAIVPLLQSVVGVLPDIATAIAEPLNKTDKMIFISSDGNSGSQLTKDITKMVSEVPEVVDAVTGVDLKKVFKRITQPGSQ
mmetsp:Transcript_1288/g.1508  ORF Transcript_1288/g.1508 Transcript_1288/m.1508 type:complete len:440 (+) Transcript_1288:197-1516(+)|eukprot:CAMPEP_0197865220 /NCGR_PEP_ID=MMETSP1438-20131217/43536_1 /TAXON_ID=1461541 /ORGANISM="Pterosperma sp., Strain CCMP1384" /LENGTH=439 /DNA_ID=CAMNT_0043483649 /DNA_START=190 /DNA_END=1509 /DNA_ORIENTATION=-